MSEEKPIILKPVTSATGGLKRSAILYMLYVGGFVSAILGIGYAFQANNNLGWAISGVLGLMGGGLAIGWPMHQWRMLLARRHPEITLKDSEGNEATRYFPTRDDLIVAIDAPKLCGMKECIGIVDTLEIPVNPEGQPVLDLNQAREMIKQTGVIIRKLERCEFGHWQHEIKTPHIKFAPYTVDIWTDEKEGVFAIEGSSSRCRRLRLQMGHPWDNENRWVKGAVWWHNFNARGDTCKLAGTIIRTIRTPENEVFPVVQLTHSHGISQDIINTQQSLVTISPETSVASSLHMERHLTMELQGKLESAQAANVTLEKLLNRANRKEGHLAEEIVTSIKLYGKDSGLDLKASLRMHWKRDFGILALIVILSYATLWFFRVVH